MLPGALHLHCSLLLRSLLFHRESSNTNHCQTQNGTEFGKFDTTPNLQNLSHAESYKTRGSFLQQSTKKQTFLFKGTYLAWTALPGISSRFSGFLHQWSSTYNCSTTTEIRAVKQNISSHCWHLCPSNSSRHSWDVLGLKINSALPYLLRKAELWGAWLGRGTIWVTNQAEDWCCGHTENHFPHAVKGLSVPDCVPQMWCDAVIGALLTLCTSILILLFISSCLFCVMPLECSVRRWQLHGRWSPIFPLMDSKTKSYMFWNLWAHGKKK